MRIAAPRPHLPALTGLRFVAAMHVVLFHTALPYLGAAPAWLKSIAGSGFVGVSLFFVLSGFILAYNYLDGGPETRVEPRSFWAARFARVYPVYALGLLVSLPFFVGDMAGRTGRTLAWFAVAGGAVPALVQSWLPKTTLIWNGPGWSLSTEAFFYLVFPLLAAPVLRLRRRGLLLLLLGAWALTFAAPLAYMAADPDRLGAGVGHVHVTFWLNVVKFNPVVRLPEFVMGVALGRLYVLRRAEGGGAGEGRWGGVLALGTAAGVAAVLAVGARLPYVVLHNGLLAPAFAALVWLLAAGRGPLGRPLAGRAMGLLGESSYALYVLHLPLSSLFHAAGVGRPGSPWFLAAYLAAAVTVSVAVLRGVEEPARRALRRRLSPRPAPEAAAGDLRPAAA